MTQKYTLFLSNSFVVLRLQSIHGGVNFKQFPQVKRSFKTSF